MALVAAAVLVAACGGKHTDDELLASNGFNGLEGRVRLSDGGGDGDGGSLTSGDGPGQVGGTSGGAAVAGGSRTGANATTSGGGGGGPGGGAAKKPPIKLGVLGTRSGLLGAIVMPFYEGAVAWANDVNARGGLNGHPVQIVPVDDGGDPRRAQAGVRDLVEKEKVAALYAEHMGTTLSAVVPYLEEKKVPVIGSGALDPVAQESPVLFYPRVGPRSGAAWSIMAPLSTRPDIKRAAIMYCYEVAVCKVQYDAMKEMAPAMGIEVVYEAQVSLAQPDYTAEVLAARNAGAQALLVNLDLNSDIRIANSAHRQSWYPLMAVLPVVIAEKSLQVGGEDAEGMVTGALHPVWTTPQFADYVQAMRKYVPNGSGPGNLSQQSWVSGKLLEKVSPHFPDGEVKPADVLRALHTVRNETLGGMIAPLTFVPGGVHNHVDCVIPLVIKNRQFVPLGSNEYVCAPGWRPGT